MNNAFIFDLDGVLIDDESLWEAQKQKMYLELFGEHITARLGSTLGVNIDGIYDRAVAAGARISRQVLTRAFYEQATDIYQTAPIPEGIEQLAVVLKELDYHIAIVSASPMAWITTVTKRLSFEDDIECIISLYERPDLNHKPAPDGYLEAIASVGATPPTTMILEDSNSGIRSAKASGAFTVGFRQNITAGYAQEGADVYADTAREVIGLVRRHSRAHQ